MEIIKRCLDQFQKHCRGGERFGEILERVGPGREVLKKEPDAGSSGVELVRA